MEDITRPCGYAAITDVGLVRAQNEDAIFADRVLGLWLVADGLGGHQGGEIASECAKAVIAANMREGANLTYAILQAHDQIRTLTQTELDKPEMGTTVVALTSRQSQYQVAWVGDSRAYLYSGSQSPALKPLSKDHSYVQSLVDSGLISDQERATHPKKNIISQCLGSSREEPIKVDLTQGQWRANERILLCSDGLTDCVSEDVIEAHLARTPNPHDVVDALLAAALQAGGRDNISVIVVDSPIS